MGAGREQDGSREQGGVLRHMLCNGCLLNLLYKGLIVIREWGGSRMGAGREQDGSREGYYLICCVMDAC